MTPELDSLFLRSFIPNLEIPPLFHFTSTFASQKIRDGKSIRLSQYNCMNDEKEFLQGLTAARRGLVRMSKRDKILKVIIEKYIPFLHSESLTPSLVPFVSCFCLRKNNKFLWHRYAKAPQGVRISFNLHEDDLRDKPMIARKVFYKSTLFRKRINFLAEKYKSHVVKNVHTWAANGSYDEKMSDLILALHRDLFLLAVFFKRRKYRKEDEYRIVIWVDPDKGEIKEDGPRRFIYWPLETSTIKELCS